MAQPFVDGIKIFLILRRFAQRSLEGRTNPAPTTPWIDDL